MQLRGGGGFRDGDWQTVGAVPTAAMAPATLWQGTAAPKLLAAPFEQHMSNTRMVQNGALTGPPSDQDG